MSKEKTAFIPKQYFAVVAVLLAIMMSVLDGTIMNIALPRWQTISMSPLTMTSGLSMPINW